MINSAQFLYAILSSPSVKVALIPSRGTGQAVSYNCCHNEDDDVLKLILLYGLKKARVDNNG